MMIAETGPGTFFSRSLRRHRLFCDVAMNPSHRIGSAEGKVTGQHLVKHDAESVEITPRIDRTIHSSGLSGGTELEVRVPGARVEGAKRYRNLLTKTCPVAEFISTLLGLMSL